MAARPPRTSSSKQERTTRDAERIAAAARDDRDPHFVEPPPAVRGARRALSSLETPTKKSGPDDALAAALFDALDSAAHTDADTFTHGFHSYPARMHPMIASVVLDAVTPAGLVVDPFCGSGTVLIEARRRGLASTGVDLNPVALRVARIKTEVRPATARDAFVRTLDDVVTRSKERVRARAPGHAPVSKAQVAKFEGHVLRELAGLYAEIEAVKDEADRRALEVVLSAILVKVSKQRADTDARDADDTAGARRMGRFIPSEIFGKKGHELAERWAAFASACPANSPIPTLALDDARALHDVVGAGKAQLILTSPPYAGTYDYVEHHALRAPWLGVDKELAALHKLEIGARRSLVGAAGRARWDADVAAFLSAASKALAKAGLIVLVIGDGEIDRVRIPADEHIAALAAAAGLIVVATASAPRRDWRGGIERAEHIVALRHL